MNAASLRVDQPRTYRVDLAGHLDDHWSDWLGGLSLVRNEGGTTTMRVELADQAQLHGLLLSIRDIGATLLSLQQTGPEPSAPVAPVLAQALHTPRLTLRPATTDDAEAIWSYRRLDGVNEWLPGVPATAEEYRVLFAEPHRLSVTVVGEVGDGDHGGHGFGAVGVVGDFTLRRDDACAQAEVADLARGTEVELGWVLDPVHSGVGYATEAVLELLRYCFEDLGVRRVVAHCFLADDSSWRLMERVGMRRETHAVEESLHRSGQWLDIVAYAVLAAEWHARHPGS
jgi:RimJ/RimL family protein N-acetyltransferase